MFVCVCVCVCVCVLHTYIYIYIYIDNWRALPLTEGSIVQEQGTKGLPGNVEAQSQVRAKFWRINPGGIPGLSTPRTIGLQGDCAAPQGLI